MNSCIEAKFQFHKGAIRTTRMATTTTSIQRFQFHKGAIRTQQQPMPNRLHPCFNSIKVRLEHHLGNLVLDELKFQFHKGAIRTVRISRSQDFFLRFNSIKVRLEQGRCVMHVSWLIGFNSIKVRLEREYGPRTHRPHYQFQFHKGAIRTNAPLE